MRSFYFGNRAKRPACAVVSRRRLLETLESRQLLALDSVAGQGLTAQYFADDNLAQWVSTVQATDVSQDWSDAAPAGLNPDSFSVRFSGSLESQTTGDHTFYLHATGGVRLWINGLPLVDQWNEPSEVQAAAQLQLVSGRRYDVLLEFRETAGLASIHLQWGVNGSPPTTIPLAQQFSSERGSVQRRIWDDIAGGEVTDLTSLETYPASPTTVQSLDVLEYVSSGADQYGSTLSGLLYPPQSGTYRFYLAGDDAAVLRLSDSSSTAGLRQIASVNSATGLRQWLASPSQRSMDLVLVEGQAYAFEVIHKENSADDHLSVGWQRPDGSEIEVIAGQYVSKHLPQVRLYSSIPTVTEGAETPLEFVVRRDSTTLAEPLAVHYVVRGTASEGVDFSNLPGSIIIPAGASQATLSVATLADQVTEGTESVIVELIDGLDYQLGFISQRQVLGNIQDVVDAIPGGTSLLPQFTLNNYLAFGGVYSEPLPVAPYEHIIQATISTVPANPWDAQLRTTIDLPIERDDVLWLEFYARSIGGPGRITAVSERNGPPYEKSLDQALVVPTTWTRFQLPFMARDSFVSGDSTIGFFLGHQSQTIQFADVHAVNYGAERNLTPATFQLNNIDGTFGSLSTVSVVGQPFDTAARLETLVTPPNNESWRFQYGARNRAGVRNGDVMKIEFYARSISGSIPRAALAVQRTDNYAILFFQNIALTSSWTQFAFEFDANDDFSANGLQAMFNLGFDPQIIELADIRWTNLSAIANRDELPSLITPISYQGRDADSDWRSLANDRIEAERQAILTVNVQDANGNPVDGAIVSLQQTNQAFQFGAAIDGFNGLLDPNGSTTAQKYQSEIRRLFSAVTLENSLKWPSFLNDRQRGLDSAQWVVDNELHFRGHNIVWPSQTNMPGSVWSEYQSIFDNSGATAAADFLRVTIENRIDDAVGTFAGQIDEWDVVNEPFDNNLVMSILGDQILVDWFQRVRLVDANVDRVLNDYDIFARNGANANHRQNFAYWLTLLKNANAIERIGEQSHYSDGNLTDIEVLGDLISEYSTTYDLPIEITEFDVVSTDRQLQADYLRDYLTMAYSQSAVTQFIQWGFWAGAHYRPDAALYNQDFSVRLNGQAYEDLVFGEWFSDVRGTTRAGAWETNVFQGDYRLIITLPDGQQVVQTLADVEANRVIQVSLPGVIWSQVSIVGAEGMESNLTAVLSEQPTSNVTIVVPSDSQVDVTPSQLVFTPENWSDPQPLTIVPIEDYTIEGDQSTTVQAETQSADPRFMQSVTTPLTMIFSDGQPPLAVMSVTIGNGVESGGLGQRSQVTQVVIKFDGLATIDADAFVVEKLPSAGEGLQTVSVASTSLDVAGQTQVKLTFSGILTVSGSFGLIDGDYRLLIDASKVRKRDSLAPLDGDGNGAMGGDFLWGDESSDRFFALFGDIDGDGGVGIQDFNVLRSAYGKATGQSGYVAALDSNRNGSNGIDDFNRFRANYGSSR
jgi:GH35 family endo-1,4-beta-xylanase